MPTKFLSVSQSFLLLALAAAAAAASPSEPRGGGGDTVVVDVVVALVRVRCAPYSSGFPFVGVWREGARGGAG